MTTRDAIASKKLCLFLCGLKPKFLKCIVSSNLTCSKTLLSFFTYWKKAKIMNVLSSWGMSSFPKKEHTIHIISCAKTSPLHSIDDTNFDGTQGVFASSSQLVHKNWFTRKSGFGNCKMVYQVNGCLIPKGTSKMNINHGTSNRGKIWIVLTIYTSYHYWIFKVFTFYEGTH